MRIQITTTINDCARELLVKPNQTLLEMLRDELHLKGTVEGCGVGVCGSCTVLVDGLPVSSCLMLSTNVDGKIVITIGLVACRTETAAAQDTVGHDVPFLLLHTLLPRVTCRGACR